jgi:hypothetical protein
MRQASVSRDVAKSLVESKAAPRATWNRALANFRIRAITQPANLAQRATIEKKSRAEPVFCATILRLSTGL